MSLTVLEYSTLLFLAGLKENGLYKMGLTVELLIYQLDRYINLLKVEIQSILFVKICKTTLILFSYVNSQLVDTLI